MKKILIVDDEDKFRNLYRVLLENEGYEIIATGKPVEVTSLLRDNDFDLILLDIKMPTWEGDKVFGLIKKNDKKIRIIVTSVLPLEEQRERIKNANDYYDKSSGVYSLVKKIKSVLGY